VLIATYNVHRCVGSDGRHDAARVAAVLREIDADVVGLQEVDAHPHVEGALDQVDYLAGATGRAGIAGPVLRSHAAHFGNALLTRHPVQTVRAIDLSIGGREPRGALDVILDVKGVPWRVVVTHLGLSGAERRRQAARLLDVLDDPPADAAGTILLGDLNEWLGPARMLRRLGRAFGGARVRSFPARMPILALDRVLVRPPHAVSLLRAHSSPLARRASDHLPVVAVVVPGS
jgi:endonuclease/exonuclease/phosphatase family metal-dependent hydrolase